MQAIVDGLLAFEKRKAVGLREELGLRWWSYARLHDAAYRSAALLDAAGIGSGDRIAIRGQNSPEWVAFFFGAVLRGAVVVPIDCDASPDLTRRICTAAGAKLLITDDAESEPGDAVPLLGMKALHDAPSPSRDVIVTVRPSDPLIVFYTSGTTAQPRGVVLSHANVIAQIARFRRWRFMTRWSAWRMLVMAPFSHAQGFILGIAVPLSLGLSVIYTHSSHPAHLIRLLRDNRVLLLSTVPRVLHVLGEELLSQQYGKGPETLAQKLERSRRWIVRRHYVFTHLRSVVGYSALWVVLVGGAPLPRADEELWRVSGCLVVQGYGLTETAAIVSVNAPMFGPVGSVGRPLGDQEVRLAEDGEILVRGANVTAANAGDGVVDGFLRTGDIGRLDRHNRLFVLGRKKEVIVTGEGFNIHGSDVEAALNAVAGVEDSVVIGKERNGHAEVHAVLLLRPGADAAAVVARANESLLGYQRVRSWTVWPERDFPRSSLMKPRRRAIAERISAAAAGESGVDSTACSLDEALAVEDRRKRLAAIARYIVEEQPDGGASAALSLVQQIGLSSLDMIELLALLERQTGRSLDNAIDDDVTVAALQSMLRDPSAAKPIPGIYEHDPPHWAEWPVLYPLRRVLNPAVLDNYVRLRARLTVTGLENLRGLELPAVFAGGGHEHGFDILLIYSALPRHVRKRLAFVTHRWIFTDALERRPDVPAGHRFVAGLGFHLVVPLFFPFVLSSQYTRSRDTMLHACRMIDRGYSIIAFGGKGLAVVARQCGVPLVPVRIDNAERADFRLHTPRARASIHFEPPIVPNPFGGESQLLSKLAELYANDSE